MSRTPTPARTRRLPMLSKLRIVLMLFALLAVIGLTVDLVTLRLRAQKALNQDGWSELVSEALIEVSTATSRWTEATGRFSVKLPPGWSVGPEGGDTYDLTLRGPYRLELQVAVRPAEPGGLEALREKLQAIEERLHLTTRLEADQFHSWPAWRRTMPLQKSTVEALDFLVGDRAVHVLMSAPPETFADFRPVLVELRDSLEVQAGQSAAGGETP